MKVGIDVRVPHNGGLDFHCVSFGTQDGLSKVAPAMLCHKSSLSLSVLTSRNRAEWL